MTVHIVNIYNVELWLSASICKYIVSSGEVLSESEKKPQRALIDLAMLQDEIDYNLE